jgi:hypothetical protein
VGWRAAPKLSGIMLGWDCFEAGRPIECWAGSTGGIARPAPASAEHEPVAAAAEHAAKTKVHGSSPNDQYDDNFRLFLGKDLADQGGGHLADT